LRQSEPVGSAVITGGGRENQGLGGQAGLAELLTEYLDGGGRVLGQVIDFNGGVFVSRSDAAISHSCRRSIASVITSSSEFSA
jgi:hypothetical protein